MIRRCNLPDEIVLPTGETLKPVIGGHLEQKQFLPEATGNGWLGRLSEGGDIHRTYDKLVIREARKRGLKYRRVTVLSRNLRGKLDLYHRPYTGTNWVFVEVKEQHDT